MPALPGEKRAGNVNHGLSMIKQTHVLLFNPKESDDPTIRKIFGDPIARALWMSVKTGHIVSQHFDDDVVYLSKIIKKHPPKDIEDLKNILLGANDPALKTAFRSGEQTPYIAAGYDEWLNYETDKAKERAHLRALLPYLIGKLEMEYAIKGGA